MASSSSSALRRSTRSTRFSGSYHHTANKRTSDSGMDQQSRTRTVEIHSPPPPDPDSEMMNVWFPPLETLKHVDVKKIRLTMNDKARFSAKALSDYARLHAPKVPASIYQKIRHQDAVLFSTWYKYDETNDEEMKDKLTLICSDGGCHSWTEQSSGITWVAVHGVDQICVVIIDAFKIVERVSLPSKGSGLIGLLYFMDRVVAEMEAIESHQLIHQSSKNGPFAVVSVVRNPDHHRSSSEASWAASGAEQGINFLVDKLKDASDFSYDETIKTAISAMQCQFCNKLKPGDVLVSVARKSNGLESVVGRIVREMWPLSEIRVAS